MPLAKQGNKSTYVRLYRRGAGVNKYAWPSRQFLAGLKWICAWCQNPFHAWQVVNPVDWLALPAPMRDKRFCTSCFRRACGRPARAYKPRGRRKVKTDSVF